MPDRGRDFFADWGPRLAEAMAAGFRGILERVDGRVYAAAIAHSQGGALRLDVNTVELAPGLLGQPRDLSDEDERHYRWWPDEWEAIADDSTPCPTDSLVQEWDSVCAEVPEERFGEFVAQTVEVLTGALGSAEVRAAFAAHGADPILVVTDTDGDADSALASLIALNRDHPDRQLYADALAYWSDIGASTSS